MKEDQAFLQSDYSAPRPPPPPLPSASCFSFSVFLYVAVKLTEGRGGGGRAWSQIKAISYDLEKVLPFINQSILSGQRVSVSISRRDLHNISDEGILLELTFYTRVFYCSLHLPCISQHVLITIPSRVSSARYGRFGKVPLSRL